MSTNDKAKHTAQKAAGGTKETLGKITGNERLKAEGKAESTKASVKKAGDHLKDAAK